MRNVDWAVHRDEDPIREASEYRDVKYHIYY